GIRDDLVTGVQTCALPIYKHPRACPLCLRPLNRRHRRGDGAEPAHHVSSPSLSARPPSDRISDNNRAAIETREESIMGRLLDLKIGRASCRERGATERGGV